ncbi:MULTISPECIES: ABC transporter ATP-binding protein [unclassified Enterobacter cloacae complex]|uniref:ABC transporter ATP-binding protein n=1 Tax=unclassified Enterobacter cloacae complex TaxID=2757714 RepID=UPI0018725654|nr:MULTISPECIES: ABC transporter ATP-binding protein [unclassified Enterobacter cloacae complex]MBE4815384.1 ABC transporter ATP-binding protein [Enterobacter cloacae complex sp. P41C]MBE4851982.1 ABC transporter ATP-binding protein [Enterobacter cloacae complex sp. P41RS]
MIAQLLKLDEHSAGEKFWRFIMCVALAGVFQGLVLGSVIIVIYALFTADMNIAIIGCLCLLTGASVNGILQSWLTMRGFSEAMRIMVVMHRRLGEQLVALPLGWFTSRATGFASGVAVRGTLFVAQTVMDLLVPLIINITTPLTIALMSFSLDWRIGCILLAGAPLIWLGARWGSRHGMTGQEQVHLTSQETDRRLLEFIDYQMLLRQAGLSGPGSKGYIPLTDAVDRQWKATIKALWSSVLGLITQSLVVQCLYGLVTGVTVWLTLTSRLEPVLAIVLIGLGAQFIGPLKILSEMGTAFRRAQIELDDVVQLMTVPVLPEAQAPHIMPARHDLSFKHVAFRYDDNTPWLFQNFSLEIVHGSLTALVGPSGCGKTTLTRLAARFWDVKKGRITLGGEDIRHLRHADLMDAVSLVFQDVCLFEDTLEANIRMGNPDASKTQLQLVADLACVTEIVNRLPQGWQSPVGEGGRLLSGGERQRVSIARALLKDAPVLLLDEATAAQDPLTGMAIARAINTLKGRTTIIVIAHQLNTVQMADQIVFIDDGQVCEQGTHQSLLARQGRYAHFWYNHTSMATKARDREDFR